MDGRIGRLPAAAACREGGAAGRGFRERPGRARPGALRRVAAHCMCGARRRPHADACGGARGRRLCHSASPVAGGGAAAARRGAGAKTGRGAGHPAHPQRRGAAGIVWWRPPPVPDTARDRSAFRHVRGTRPACRRAAPAAAGAPAGVAPRGAGVPAAGPAGPPGGGNVYGPRAVRVTDPPYRAIPEPADPARSPHVWFGGPAGARQMPRHRLRIKICDRYCRLHDSGYRDKPRANK